MIFMNLSAQSSSRFDGCLTASLRAHRRGVSPQYVNRRVVVGMGFETAMATTENRLAFATSAVNGSAFRTRLARVSSRHFNQRPAAFFKFVRKDGFERVPTLIENRSVETGLGANAATWGGDSAGSARRHVGYLQVLHDDRSEPARNIQCGTMMPVPADAGALGGQSGASAELPQPTLGAFLATRKDALSAPVLTVYGRKAHWDGQMLAGRERKRIGDAAVNANGRKATFCFPGSDFASERNEPAIAISGNCNGTKTARHRPRVAIFDPSYFGYPHGRPFCAQTSGGYSSAWESKTIVHVPFSASRVLTTPGEEAFERTVKVSERLNKAIIWYSCDPIKLAAQVGNFETLVCEIQTPAGYPQILPPKITTLHKCEIIHEARHASELLKLLLLLRCWTKPISKPAMHHASQFLSQLFGLAKCSRAIFPLGDLTCP
jgi:hypothetical protein